MFEKASLMVLLQNGGDYQVCKIETDRKMQAYIGQSFTRAYYVMLKGAERIAFDGNYCPGADGAGYIPGFAMNEVIREAVETPAAIGSFISNKDSKDSIKAIFVGEIRKGKMTIAFKKFKREQHFHEKGINPFFGRKTFVKEKRFGFSVSEEIDCVFEDGQLLFKSFFVVQQIFGLMPCYRENTQGEEENFTQKKELDLNHVEMFMGQADSHVHKKTETIIDSGVLEKFTAREIQKTGRQAGMDAAVGNKKGCELMGVNRV